MLTPAEFLSARSPLVGHVEGFAARAQQQEMAEAIARTLDQYGMLVCEAGSGTGKTFAYLVPALMSGKKVIVSTGTKHLQDQLFHRDLPVVREALAIPVHVALLKGRVNYLCVHRLGQAEIEAGFLSPQVSADLQSIKAWAGRTQTGDRAELVDIPEDASVWPHVTSTADNCLGQECPLFNDCYVVKARREANEAEILVVNHHLFLADMALRDEGFGEVLPGAEAVIFDEAHQLPEVASEFFGITLTSRQLIELARDSKNAYLSEARDVPTFTETCGALEKTVAELRLTLGSNDHRAAWEQAKADHAVSEALASLKAMLAHLQSELEPLAERAKVLESCGRRCALLLAQLNLFADVHENDHIQWYETRGRGFRLYETPLDISEAFQSRLNAYQCAWIFTSATLAIGSDFRHFTSQLGLNEAEMLRWDSPYDYETQTLLYIPDPMPDPRDPSYTAAVINAALPVLKASQGRAFLLFTSHRALSEGRGLLEDRIKFPLIVQGEGPRSELLRRFRALNNAVLLGTSSFWEGVDVRGEALSCVIIDKLPFASPEDPVLQARISKMQSQGRDPFVEFQLPQAVIALKQGVGRLIRDVRDRGVLVLCDPRLFTRGYGHVFLDGLPPMPQTRDIKDVRRFLSEHKSSEIRAKA